MNIFKKLNNWTKDNDSINKIADNILLILIIVILFFILICILVHFILCYNFTYVFTPVIALSVPFLIMKFNKLKEEKQNEDFRKIINTSIFNCLYKFQNILIESQNVLKEKNLIADNGIKDGKFYNPIYFSSSYSTYSYELNKLYDFTKNEINEIENSRLQFQNYDNFLLLIKYKEIIDRYNKKYELYNKMYKELYEILEINKDKIKEMII